MSLDGWVVGVQLHPYSPVLLVHCQDLKQIPHPRGLVSWINTNPLALLPTRAVLGTSTVCRSTQRYVSMARPVGRRMQSDGRIADSTQPSPGSVLSDPELSAISRPSVDHNSRFAPVLLPPIGRLSYSPHLDRSCF